MNILFLTLVRTETIETKGLYKDLMRKFRDEGHQVYIISPCERRLGIKTCFFKNNGVNMLNVRTLNVQKTNIAEKGIGTLLMERQYKNAVKNYLNNTKFDLILYSTPPITLTNVVKFLKRKNPLSVSYLLLKDIFPQNAVDIGIFGEKSIFYWYFRRKEIALYKVSDYIGCMSPANVEFLKVHDSFYPSDHIDVAPNSYALKEMSMDDDQMKTVRATIRNRYDLPKDKPIFIYGGNLGKPQGIDYLIKCLEAIKKRSDCFFLIVGTGTEYRKLDNWVLQNKNSCVKLMSKLPREDYDLLVESCDVGLIFLDHRFTIPNYPSRLLSYLENRMPVICATDVTSDVGKIAEKNGYGYWCESVNPDDFVALVDKMIASDRKAMGERGYLFMKNNYLSEHTYNAIMSHFK